MRAAAATALLALALPAASVAETLGPRPGDVYREFAQHLYWPKEWRIIDPESTHKRARRDYLPNPVLSIDLHDVHADSGALRAEVQIDRWGGHLGTTEKKIRFNGNPWIEFPDITTVPEGEARCYYYQDNPILPLPLSHLKEGKNSFEGTAGRQTCFNFGWGQWGLHGLFVRVYYPPSKPHPVGRIVAPRPGEILGENPQIVIEAQSVVGIDRVDVLAYYDGFDENGDGIFEDWHYRYDYTDLVDHVGTATKPPFVINWDTRMVPDQRDGAVKVLARIRDKNGVWFVTEPVEKLGLRRSGGVVRLFKPPLEEIPQKFNVRLGERKSVSIRVSPEPGMRPVEAILLLRTWDGGPRGEGVVRVNRWSGGEIGGKSHDFAFTLRPFPVKDLVLGDNVVEFYSKTVHHGPEILWPGPAILVRYAPDSGRGAIGGRKTGAPSPSGKTAP
jgi:hypothetical protein